MSDTNGSNGRDNSGRSSMTPRLAPVALPEIQVSDREMVKQILRAKLKRWCENTNEGVERNERNAMNNYARAMGIAGAEVEVNIALMLTKELGVASIEEARRKLQMVESVAGIDEDAAMSVIEQHLRGWYAQRGMRVVIMADDARELPAHG